MTTFYFTLLIQISNRFYYITTEFGKYNIKSKNALQYTKKLLYIYKAILLASIYKKPVKRIRNRIPNVIANIVLKSSILLCRESLCLSKLI